MICWLFRSFLFSLRMLKILIVFFPPVIEISSYCIVVRKDDWNDFNLFEFTKARLMAQYVIYSGEDSLCTWEKGEVDYFGLKCPIDIS